MNLIYIMFNYSIYLRFLRNKINTIILAFSIKHLGYKFINHVWYTHILNRNLSIGRTGQYFANNYIFLGIIELVEFSKNNRQYITI